MVSGALEAEFRTLASTYYWNNGTPPEGRDGHPVTLVGYEDAIAYAGGSRARRHPVRLPTEAEWERAARGGLVGQTLSLGRHARLTRAHFLPPAGVKEDDGTAPVGAYPANGFQLYDMAGNVWEWVSDWYAPNYYELSQYQNPQGPESGLMRIVRGGAWVNSDGRYLRCAYRHKVPPDSYAYSIGFRIAYSTEVEAVRR